MQILNLQDCALSYHRQGPKGGPLLIFANALGTDKTIWNGVLPHIDPRWQTLTYDKRGHGQSQAYVPFGMSGLVGDVYSLVSKACEEDEDELDIVFVGLSIGGLIGLSLAANRPSWLRGLVFMDSAAKIGTDEIWQDRIADVRERGLAATVPGVMERWFGADYVATGKARALEQLVANQSQSGYLACAKIVSETDFRPLLPQISLPVLGLVGRDDGATPPELVEDTINQIHDAEFAVIEGAGHIPCYQQPEAVAQHINEFIKDLV